MNNYQYWDSKLASQDLGDFSTSEEAKLWLKIHSIAKREVMKGFEERYKDIVSLSAKTVEEKAKELYGIINDADIKQWNHRLDTYFLLKDTLVLPLFHHLNREHHFQSPRFLQRKD